MKKFFVIDEIDRGFPVVSEKEGSIITIDNLNFGIIHKSTGSWTGVELTSGLGATFNNRTRKDCIEEIQRVMPAVKKCLSSDSTIYNACKKAIEEAYNGKKTQKK